jgi:integrase
MANKRTAKLTQGCVNGLIPAATQFKVWDTELKGLYVLVLPSGTITYYYAYRLNDKQCCPKVGRHGSLTAPQARAIAKDYAAKAAQGTDVQAEKQSARQQTKRDSAALLGAFITDQYTPWAQSHMKSHKETLRMLNVDWLPILGSRPMAGITQWDVQKWASQRSLKASTLQRRITALQGVISKAKEWGVIDQNPLQGMKQLKQDDAARVRYLTPQEEQMLRAALTARQEGHRQGRERYNQWRTNRQHEPYPPLQGKFTDHLAPIVLLAMNTGLRRGELFNLEWHDVNLSGRMLTVRGATAKSGKTRHIPLNDEAFSTLVAWRNQNSGGVGLVLPNPQSGARLTTIKTAWAKLLQNAGITDFRFHDLRHHFASRLVMGGVDLNTVRELLGHASLEMTLRYAHLAPEHKAAAVAVLDR